MCRLLVALVVGGCGRISYEPQLPAADAGDRRDVVVRSDSGDASPAIDAPGTDAPGTDAPRTDAGLQVQALAIQSDADDGELETSGDYGINGFAQQGEANNAIFMGGYDTDERPGEGLTFGYFRFALQAGLPAGATVERAQLRVYATDQFWWDASDFLWIALEDSADAAVISAIADAPLRAGGRPLTATVRWPEAGALDWTFDTWHETSDFGTLLQELVDRYGGLATGAHVQVFVYRDGGTTNGEVAVEDFSHPATHHAELVVEWR